MQKVPGDDKADTSAWDDYTKILKKESPESEPTFCERFSYYERAKKAYAVIITGEERQYANIILKKGCVLPGMKKQSNISKRGFGCGPKPLFI